MPSPLAQPDRARFEPLWDRVDRNRWRLTGYVLAFIAASVVGFDMVVGVPFAGLVAYASLEQIGGYGELFELMGAVLAFVSTIIAAVASAWSVFTILRSEKWLLRRLGATLIPKGEHVDAKSALKDMALAAGFETAPALYLLDTPNVNAFVISARRRRAVVGVTRGMLDRYSHEEQRAVFANLMARLGSGDTIVSTGVSALMWPMSAMRDRPFRADDAQTMRDMGLPSVARAERAAEASARRNGGATFLALTLFAFGFVVLGEFLVVGNRAAQLKASEKADSEGMLLLKEPLAMLRALEKTVRLNNSIPVADHAFGQLFYAWPGAATDDESDPEWTRVARLREVLGVEGMAWRPAEVAVDPQAIAAALAPPAPRLEDDRGV